MTEITRLTDNNSLTPYWQPPADFDYQKWCATLGEMLSIYRVIPFQVGDLVAYGEDHYEEAFAQALDLTRIGYETLRGWVWVARRIKPETRVADLSWSHHRAVAKLPDIWQKLLLYAARETHIASSDLGRIAGIAATLPLPLQYRLFEQFQTDHNAADLLESIRLYPATVIAGVTVAAATPTSLAPRGQADRLYLSRIQAASAAIDRTKWLSTLGAELPIVLRPAERENLTIHSTVTADQAFWTIGDHANQIIGQVRHLARLERWDQARAEAEMQKQLQRCADKHHLSLAELRQHAETAQAFPIATRTQNEQIGHQHHRLVRHLDAQARALWLESADRQHWTPAELAAELAKQEDPS